MTQAQLAWAVRVVMVIAAALASYALVQTDLPLSPEWKFLCGAVNVVCAALNAKTVAEKVGG